MFMKNLLTYSNTHRLEEGTSKRIQSKIRRGRKDGKESSGRGLSGTRCWRKEEIDDMRRVIDLDIEVNILIA